MWRALLLIIVCWPHYAVLADDPADAARQERLTAMRRRAETLQLGLNGKTDKVRVQAEPIFRYNDPARTTTDGTLWLWCKEERPLAVLCLFMDDREDFAWNYELVSLTNESVRVDGRPGWHWQPQEAVRPEIKLTQPKISSSSNARLGQMKAIASLFRAEEDLDGNAIQLRLLARPAHRYRSEKQGVEDGAIFLFAYGTNPEVVAQVEARTDGSWRLYFARLTAAEARVFRDDDKVWSAARVRVWDRQHEYFSHYGPDRDGTPRPSQP